VAHRPVGVEVTEEQDRLKEKQAGRPDGGRPAEPWQEDLADHRLDLEKQKGARENRHRIKESHSGPPGAAAIRHATSARSTTTVSRPPALPRFQLHQLAPTRLRCSIRKGIRGHVRTVFT